MVGSLRDSHATTACRYAVVGADTADNFRLADILRRIREKMSSLDFSNLITLNRSSKETRINRYIYFSICLDTISKRGPISSAGCVKNTPSQFSVSMLTNQTFRQCGANFPRVGGIVSAIIINSTRWTIPKLSLSQRSAPPYSERTGKLSKTWPANPFV